MATNSVTAPLSERLLKEDGSDTVQWINRELIPLLRQIRTALNSGPAGDLLATSISLDGDSLLPDRRLLDVGAGGTRLFAVRTGGGGVDVSLIEVDNCLVRIFGTGERMLFANDGQIAFGTASAVLVGNVAGTGLNIGSTTSEPIAFHGVAPVACEVLATGAAHTVDDVITKLQAKGIVKQA